MLAIQRIITFGCVWALGAFAVIGCENSGWLVGKWRGTRALEVREHTDPSVGVSLRRVTLKVFDDGHFDLVDHSLPFSGRIGSKNGEPYLDVDTVLGRAIDTHPGALTPPQYTVKRIDANTIELNGDSSVQLRRVEDTSSKP